MKEREREAREQYESRTRVRTNVKFKCTLSRAIIQMGRAIGYFLILMETNRIEWFHIFQFIEYPSFLVFWEEEVDSTTIYIYA